MEEDKEFLGRVGVSYGLRGLEESFSMRVDALGEKKKTDGESRTEDEPFTRSLPHTLTKTPCESQ